MSSYNQTEEIANMGGGGYGYGSSMLWWVLILVLVFLFFFRRDGHEGSGNDCCSIKGCRPAYYDESNWEEENHLRQNTDLQAEKTRGLIEANYKEQANKEFMKELTEKSELKNKIYMLENEKYIDSKFDRLTGLVQTDYNSLYREIDRLPKPSPCYAPTCTTPVCSPCTINPCSFNSPCRGE